MTSNTPQPVLTDAERRTSMSKITASVKATITIEIHVGSLGSGLTFDQLDEIAKCESKRYWKMQLPGVKIIGEPIIKVSYERGQAKNDKYEYWDGFYAFYSGAEKSENPYDCNSDGYVDWNEGYSNALSQF